MSECDIERKGTDFEIECIRLNDTVEAFSMRAARAWEGVLCRVIVVLLERTFE
jgi:hypothetical protein